MNLEEAFLRDIAEHPAEDAPRLIYADWLEEQDDERCLARARFIRIQIERSELPAEAPRQAAPARSRGPAAGTIR